MRIDVRRFDLVPGQYALLEARWRMRFGPPGSENASELICQTRHQTPAGNAIEDLVVARQKNLQKLAVTLNEVDRTGARTCR